jgi:Rrf2 family protein
MKISTRVEFGIVALVDIALNSDKNETITMYSIAQRHNISSKYLEQILTVLRQANFIRGIKGSKGGYTISKPMDKITLKEIINALDISVLADVNFYNLDEKSVVVSTINTQIWDKMTSYLQNFAENITLADIIEMCKNTYAENEEGFMYYI